VKRRSPLPLALLAALTLAACGGGGGGTTGADTGGGEEGGTFKATDVGFTFKYPTDFKQVDEDNGKVLAIVAPDPADADNGLKIRQTAAQELPLSAYLDEFRRQFQQQIPRVDKRIEQHNGIEMGVLSFTGNINQGGQQQRVTSSSYFFAGGGKTWQLECLTKGEQHKSMIDAACKQAVDSVSFS
jgi:hypothetical protein